MDIITEIPALQAAVGAHYATRLALFPPEAQAHLTAAFGHASPVQRMAEYAEALYAARAHLDDPDRILTGQIAHLCGLQGYSLFGFGDGPDGRGGRMFQAMRRDLDEDGADQPPEDDPAPLAHLVPPGAEPEEEPEPEE